MKSLPEQKFWKAISSRLADYSEVPPADDWDKIAGAIPSRPSGAIGLNRSSDVLVLILLAFLLGFQTARFSGESDSPFQSSSIEAVGIQPPPGSKMADTSLDVNRPATDSLHLRSSAKISVKTTDGHIAERQPENHLPEKPHQKKSSRGVYNNEVSSHNREEFLLDETDNRISTTPNGLSAGSDSPVPTKTAPGTPGVANNNLEIDSVTPAVAKRPGDETQTEKDSLKNAPVTRGHFQPEMKQTEEKKKSKKFHPTVFVQVNPSMAYHKVMPLKNDAVTIQQLNSPGIFAADRFAFSGEIGLQAPVTRYLEAYASVGFHRQRTTISYDYASGETVDVSSSADALSFNVVPATETKSYTYSLQHATFSAGALYLLKGTRLSHKIGGGVFYMAGNTVWSEDPTRATRTQFAGYQLLYRIEYGITARTNFYIQPVFRHSLFSNGVKSEAFSVKPYWAGLSFGVAYKF